jgi:hypothetical protein
MKKNILLGMMFLAAGSVMADTKDDVKAAATALGSADNYTWKQTVEVPDGGFGASSNDGKTEKGGYTSLNFTFGDNTTQAFLKGTNGAINSPDNGWQSLAEATQGGGGGGGGFNPATFLARMVQNYKTPDLQAAQLADAAADLKAGDNGSITGSLTDDGAKALMSFGGRGRRGGGTPPEITNPKGTVIFWLTDGKLTKYSFHVTGSMSFGGQDRDIDRTTTVVISDVGTTKIEVPDDAKKKLE